MDYCLWGRISGHRTGSASAGFAGEDSGKTRNGGTAAAAMTTHIGTQAKDEIRDKYPAKFHPEVIVGEEENPRTYVYKVKQEWIRETRVNPD